MAGIEALREKLHAAVKSGDAQQVLEISQELDCEIVKFMKDMLNKPVDVKDKLFFETTSNLHERSCEHG